MTVPNLIALSDLSQGVTILLSLLAYIPQWGVMLRTGSSENISIRAWLIWLLSSGLALFYAAVQFSVYHTGAVLLWSAAAAFTFVAVTLMLVLWFRIRAWEPVILNDCEVGNFSAAVLAFEEHNAPEPKGGELKGALYRLPSRRARMKSALV